MIIQGQVRPPSNVSATDGVSYDILQGKLQEAVVSELHGKYYTQCYRGNIFMSSTAATPAVIPASATTSPTFALWNPQGNNKIASLIRFSLGWVVNTNTAAAGNISWSYLSPAGATTATAAPISAFAAGVTINGFLGNGNQPTIKAGIGTITCTAVAHYRTTSFAQEITTGGTTAQPFFTLTEDYDGTFLIPPGVMVCPTATIATVTTYIMSAVWEEIPI